MIIFIIVAVVVAILIAGFFHTEHLFHKIKIAVFIIIALLVLSSIFGFFNSDKADLNSPKGVIGSVYSYFGWLGDKGGLIFSTGKDAVITIGNVIRGNETETAKINDGRK